MHAFLIVGPANSQQSTIDNLANKLKAKVMEFPLTKIDDVRNLNDLLRLSFETPTLIVCSSIHEAGEEALNAFLKNLEEPQENIYFALTAPSSKKVLPTIVSRCQIIKVSSNQLLVISYEEIEKFFKMTKGEKLLYISKIKDRDEAIEFIENVIAFMHQTLHFDGSLHKKELKYIFTAEDVRLAIKTLSRLNGFGNVNLQLSNFVINYGK